MPTAIENIPRNQITMLESGLKSFKQSKLITSREMRDMYSAIEVHHRDVRLAHLTGKPKDLLEQAKQDTKFFYILTKMLKEVLIGTQREQIDNLREVYSWYQSNKHVLRSAPRFGRQKLEKENRLPGSGKSRIRSAKSESSRPGSGVTDVSSTSRGRPGSGISKLGHIQRQASDALAKDYEFMNMTDLNELEGLHTLQEDRQGYNYGSQSADMSVPPQSSMSAMSQFEYQEELQPVTQVRFRQLMGGSSPDMTSSATKRISEPYQHLLPKRTAQPLSHMYNPHAREHEFGQGEPATNGPVKFTAQNVGRNAEPKTPNMRKWEQYQQQYAYGQEILSKLAYCGRTGVAGGVRYIAHDGGLAAEYMTPIVVSSYAKIQDKEQPKKEPVKNMLAEKSLEEFYDLSENYYPAHLPKYPSFSRAKSAATSRCSQQQQSPSLQSPPGTSPERKDNVGSLDFQHPIVVPVQPPPSSPVSVKSSMVTFDESHNGTAYSAFDDNFSEITDSKYDSVSIQPSELERLSPFPHSETEPRKNLKLDTVVHMIDSVTDEMTHYKEKILPAPQPGFRQPIQEVDPQERPQTAPTRGTVARPSSPLGDDDRPATVASSKTGHASALDYNRCPSPPASLYGGPYKVPRRPESRVSVAATDISEGRASGVPDRRRYNEEEYVIHEEVFRLPSLDGLGDPEKNKHVRWQETPFGGRTYYRKRPGSSLRSAGVARVPTGGRPKTAPQTPRERWPTDDPSEENKKPAVAASHNTTEVDDDVMEHMLEVRHLGGKYGKQRRRFYYDYRSDSRSGDRYSSMTPTPAMEYLSFIAPKPVSRASSTIPPRSHMGSSMDGAMMPFGVFSDDDHHEQEEDEESMGDSMGNDLDLPDVDDLDDDLGDDFQYEGDELPEGEFPIDDDNFRDELDPLDGEETGGEIELIERPSVGDFDIEITTREEDQLSTEKPEETNESEGDFDSVNIQSSTQESGTDIDIEQQVADSRKLIDEIADLVEPPNNIHNLSVHLPHRPVSSVSRVTFQDDQLETTGNHLLPTAHSAELVSSVGEAEGSAGGRKVLQPKSILVPRHIQPPPNVGLTIVQFNRGPEAGGEGLDNQRNVVKPMTAPASSSSYYHQKQELNKSDYLNYTVPESGDFTTEGSILQGAPSPRSATVKPRQFIHSFPKTAPHPPPEDDLGLSVEGFSGGNKQRVRSAGAVPMRARSVNHQRVLQRQREMLRNAPAVQKTAPSIPSPHHQFGSRATPAASSSQFMPELEKQARRDHSPRHFMQKVGGLRSKSDLSWASGKLQRGTNGYLTTTLRVARIQPSGRTENESPEQRSGYPGTPVSYFEEDKSSSKGDMYSESEGQPSTTQEVVTPLNVGGGSNGGKVTKVYLYHGRPIPEYGEAKTPEQYNEAMQLQREAKAAVDIQRIFRGFLVRNNYKYLDSEERKRKEDQRKAALKIQKSYRGHLVRKDQILNRPTTKPETLEWAHSFKQEQKERERIRAFKAHEVAEQNARNKAEADAKLSIIGPHVEVYIPFHPKKTGPDKTVLNSAAICIQRHMRGWLIRKRFEKIQRKAKHHSSSWTKFMSQYRDLLRRVQTRSGNERPKTAFDFDDINEFMDTKKRYEAKYNKVANGPYFDAQGEKTYTLNIFLFNISLLIYSS